MKTKELEISEKIEIRLDMICAHTKLGKTIQEVIKEFDVCLDTYYYWYHRYLERGIFGLFDSKKGPKVTHNKTKNDVASKIVETAYRHPEMDAPEILEVLDFSSVHKPSVVGIEEIEKECERFNVYTNPLANPQRNPNVDPKRREPLTDMEIKAIKEAHQKYPEMSSWNLSLLLSNITQIPWKLCF